MIGWIIAKVLAKVIGSVLERVGFDRAVERGGVKKAMARTKYDASDILAKLVFYIVMLFVLQLAFGVFPNNPITELITGIIAFLPNIFVAIIILVVAAAIAAAVREIVEASLGGLGYGSVLANVAAGAIIAIGLFAALDQLRIAPDIVNGLFYALLALVVGSAIVAIGGWRHHPHAQAVGEGHRQGPGRGPEGARGGPGFQAGHQGAGRAAQAATGNRRDHSQPRLCTKK